MRSFVRLGWPVSNAWLLPETDIGPVLVDTGHPTTWLALRAGLRRRGLRPVDLRAVVLTHRHSDHAGNAARLERLGVPLLAHPRDIEILAGDRSGPAIDDRSDPFGRLFCRLERRFPARPCRPAPLVQGDTIAGLTVIETPGHTLGSIMLHHAASGTLFTGDALLNAAPPLTLHAGLTLPYPPYCDDAHLALDSLRRLLDLKLNVQTLCPGHGPPRHGALPDALRQLLEA